MKKSQFINRYFPLACEVEKRFQLNPVVILAQSALETGWGESTLARNYNNFFGITAAGRANEFWGGEGVMLARGTLSFRVYDSPLQSFMDYGRLLRAMYKLAAGMSYDPQAFAKEMAYSRYISEVNGDNREAYRRGLVAISLEIGKLKVES